MTSCVYVNKLCVDKLCVDKLCVSKLCGDKLGERRAEGGGRRRRKCTTKNKNPTQRCGELDKYWYIMVWKFISSNYIHSISSYSTKTTY